MLFSYQSKSSAPSIVWVSESVFLRELRLRNIGKLERQVGLVYPTFTMYSQTARQLRDRTRRPRKSRLKTVYSSSSAAAPVTIEIGISLSPALQFRAHTHTRRHARIYPLCESLLGIGLVRGARSRGYKARAGARLSQPAGRRRHQHPRKASVERTPRGRAPSEYR